MRPKAFWNIIYIYVFTPKISQDFPTKDSSVTHKENNIGTRKVENIYEDSLDLIPSPSPSVKIQIVGGKVCLRCKGKTLSGVVNKFLKTKSLLTSPSNIT